MNKLLSTIFVALLISTGVFAQQVVQQDIDVNAVVIAKLAIVSTVDVDMGTIVTGTASILPANANDQSTVTNAGVGATPGQIVVSGAAGESMSVTYTNATLTNASGASANFVPSVYEGSTAITSGDDVTFTATSGNSGQVSIDIGGLLTSVPDGSEGDYSTTNAGGSPITFTFTYTSI